MASQSHEGSGKGHKRKLSELALPEAQRPRYTTEDSSAEDTHGGAQLPLHKLALRPKNGVRAVAEFRDTTASNAIPQNWSSGLTTTMGQLRLPEQRMENLTPKERKIREEITVEDELADMKEIITNIKTEIDLDTVADILSFFYTAFQKGGYLTKGMKFKSSKDAESRATHILKASRTLKNDEFKKLTPSIKEIGPMFATRILGRQDLEELMDVVAAGLHQSYGYVQPANNQSEQSGLAVGQSQLAIRPKYQPETFSCSYCNRYTSYVKKDFRKHLDRCKAKRALKANAATGNIGESASA